MDEASFVALHSFVAAGAVVGIGKKKSMFGSDPAAAKRKEIADALKVAAAATAARAEAAAAEAAKKKQADDAAAAEAAAAEQAAAKQAAAVERDAADFLSELEAGLSWNECMEMVDVSLAEGDFDANHAEALKAFLETKRAPSEAAAAQKRKAAEAAAAKEAAALKAAREAEAERAAKKKADEETQAKAMESTVKQYIAKFDGGMPVEEVNC